MVATLDSVTDDDYHLRQVATNKLDYYTGAGEAPGVWTGSLAETMGLHGQEVTPEALKAVLHNRDPVTGEPLKPHDNLKVLGWDMTFSAPKSVSAFMALADEPTRQRLFELHDFAADTALAYVEREACVARLGKAGSDPQPGTGFLAATFRQRTSREGDPQLHSHTVMANVVYAADGRGAAPDGRLLYKHCKAAGGVYDAILRAEITREFGFRWTRRGKHLEIAGMPAGLCRLWSKRRRQIEKRMAEKGTSSARSAQIAALDTRKPKHSGDEGDEEGLYERWRREGLDDRHLEQAGLTLDGLAEQLAQVQIEERDGLADFEIIEALLGPDGLTEKASSFGRRDVVYAVADLLDPAEATWERINSIVNAVLGDGRCIRLLNPARPTSGEVISIRNREGRVVRTVCAERERRYTTRSLLDAEHEVLERTAQGRDRETAVIPEPVVEQTIAAFGHLDVDQQAVVRGLCVSGNTVDLVRGRAGTGKSAMLNAYRHALKDAGIPVTGVAPSATAAHLLGQAADLPGSRTAHRLLAETEHLDQQLPAGSVVICDEAGMADTRTLLALLRQVDDAGGKLVLVGDERQVPSVDVGGLLPRIGQLAGAYELTVNHRFDDVRQRDAAEQIRSGDPHGGIEQLAGLGLVHEHDRADDAWDHLVGDWLELVEQGEVARMFTDTNHVVDDLNQRARNALIATGKVQPAAVTFTDDDTGRDLDLAAGDRVRLGRNLTRLPQLDGQTAAVRNGMEGLIVAVHRAGVTVRLDAEHRAVDGPGEVWLPAGYAAADVTYAYALTCDKAQAATVDHSLYAATDRASRERAYVALSRGRSSNRIYAAADSGWQDALKLSRAHDPASDQQPDLPPPPSDEHASIFSHDEHDQPHRLDEPREQRAVEDVRARLLRHHAHDRPQVRADQLRRPRGRSIAM